MAVRIGTSGFHYDHWHGRFYPPSARGAELEHYAGYFDTVELNVTFYRMPSNGRVRRADGAAPREAELHASTRILLVLVAIAAIGGGWWVLLSMNDVGTGIVYSVLWTILVLVAARILLAVGFGYNRLTAGRGQDSKGRPADAAAALAELTDLRDRELISAEEYEAKRAKVLERL